MSTHRSSARAAEKRAPESEGSSSLGSAADDKKSLSAAQTRTLKRQKASEEEPIAKSVVPVAVPATKLSLRDVQRRYNWLVEWINEEPKSNLVTKTILIEELKSQFIGKDIFSSSLPETAWKILHELDDNKLELLTPLCPLNLDEFVRLSGIMGRGYDALAILLGRKSLKEADKTMLFDAVFIPILRLFNGAISVVVRRLPFEQRGLRYHRTLTLGGISVIYIVLDHEYDAVVGLTQLLAEMLATQQQNAKDGVNIDINGILTNGIRYLFIVSESGTGQFKLRADLNIDGENSDLPSRFGDEIVDVINMIFSILLGSFEDALSLISHISEKRSKEDNITVNSAHFVEHHRRRLKDTVKKQETIHPPRARRDSFKNWFNAYQSIKSIKNDLKQAPIKESDSDREVALKGLSLMVKGLRDVMHSNDKYHFRTQTEFQIESEAQVNLVYQSKCNASLAHLQKRSDLFVFGNKSLRDLGGNVEIRKWCKEHHVAQATVDWIIASDCRDTFELSHFRLRTSEPAISIPLGHLLEIKRAAGIPVENPVFEPHHEFPDKPVEEFIRGFNRILEKLKEAEIQNAQVLYYLSKDHVEDIGWSLTVINVLARHGSPGFM